jgi:hypothetical protein
MKGRRNISRVQEKEETPKVCANASTTKPEANPMRYCNESGSSKGRRNKANRKSAGVI